jgi:hypothetical protein
LHRRFGGIFYGARRYAVAEHVPQSPYGTGPIADMIVQDCWAGRDQWPLLGFEIKCSRSDWLTELANPGKSEAWRRYCTRWYLAAADQNIVRDDLPAGWGLLVVQGDRLIERVKAPKLRPEPMPHMTAVALLRQVQKAASRRAEFRVPLSAGSSSPTGPVA